MPMQFSRSPFTPMSDSSGFLSDFSLMSKVLRSFLPPTLTLAPVSATMCLLPRYSRVFVLTKSTAMIGQNSSRPSKLSQTGAMLMAPVFLALPSVEPSDVFNFAHIFVLAKSPTSPQSERFFPIALHGALESCENSPPQALNASSNALDFDFEIIPVPR